MRPRIGITTSTLARVPEGAIQVSSATHLSYAQCVYQAGGWPLLLPNLPAADDADEILATLDGLLLSGGGDVDPGYWGEAPHPALGEVDAVRDAFELALVRAALRRDLPLLGICRGTQVMAVATGGTLWQHLPGQVPNALAHLQSLPREQASHSVSIAADSLLTRVIDAGERASAMTLTIDVNSFHHQAVKTCGNIFAAIAWSPDGVIEGLAAPRCRFALGVQWHPEEMCATNATQARLFTALIDAARPCS